MYILGWCGDGEQNASLAAYCLSFSALYAGSVYMLLYHSPSTFRLCSIRNDTINLHDLLFC